MPDMQSVGSSSISRAGWEDGSLFVEFVGGEQYRYDNVAEDVFESFLGASSPGQFFHGSIRPYGGEKI